MINAQKIGIGTVQFGLDYGISNKEGKTNKSEVEQILKTAELKGIQYIDTASAYGSAEEVIGQYDLKQFKIVSKFMPPLKGKKISKQFNQSLFKLNQTSLYGYLAHRPLDLLDNPELWVQLKKLKSRGLVEKIGYSLNEPFEIHQLLEKGFDPDLIQVPYNYFDRRFEDIMIDLKKKGCEIHTRSTFLQGLFFMNPKELSVFFEEIKVVLNTIQNIKPLNGALLEFVLDKTFIDKVIIGVENVEQLKQNINNINDAPQLPDLKNIITENILIPSRWPKN
jgi:aryl-alcohol dehydrogenase-like predicted oxidoreductase